MEKLTPRQAAGTAKPVLEGMARERDAAELTNMRGCQNYGPFLDPYYNTAPNI